MYTSIKKHNIPQIGHRRVGLQPLPGAASKVTGQTQPHKSQVGPLVDAPQRHLDPAALGQMTGHAAAAAGSAALAGLARGRLGAASLAFAGGRIGRVVVVLFVLRLDGGVGEVVRVEMGQMTALQEGRAGHQLLLGEDGIDVVVRVLRHGCWDGRERGYVYAIYATMKLVLKRLRGGREHAAPKATIIEMNKRILPITFNLTFKRPNQCPDTKILAAGAIMPKPAANKTSRPQRKR